MIGFVNKIFYLGLSILLLLLLSCKKVEPDPQPQPPKDNKVLLMQLNYSDFSMEGIKVLEFATDTPFSINTAYDTAAGVELVEIIYEALNERIFYGSMLASGLGERIYPPDMDNPEFYDILNNPISLPASLPFDKVIFNSAEHYPATLNKEAFWAEIRQYEIVMDFYASNSNARIAVYLHKLNLSNSATWHWYLFLKN
jgi:hypothetical protein